MTQSKAATVAAAVINAGFQATAYQRATDGQWVVRARSETFNVPATSVTNLATAQSVTANVAEAEFS